MVTHSLGSSGKEVTFSSQDSTHTMKQSLHLFGYLTNCACQARWCYATILKSQALRIRKFFPLAYTPCSLQGLCLLTWIWRVASHMERAPACLKPATTSSSYSHGLTLLQKYMEVHGAMCPEKPCGKSRWPALMTSSNTTGRQVVEKLGEGWETIWLKVVMPVGAKTLNTRERPSLSVGFTRSGSALVSIWVYPLVSWWCQPSCVWPWNSLACLSGMNFWTIIGLFCPFTVFLGKSTQISSANTYDPFQRGKSMASKHVFWWHVQLLCNLLHAYYFSSNLTTSTQMLLSLANLFITHKYLLGS